MERKISFEVTANIYEQLIISPLSKKYSGKQERSLA
jgi:hypothetical protein